MIFTLTDIQIDVLILKILHFGDEEMVIIELDFLRISVTLRTKDFLKTNVSPHLRFSILLNILYPLVRFPLLMLKRMEFSRSIPYLQHQTKEEIRRCRVLVIDYCVSIISGSV